MPRVHFSLASTIEYRTLFVSWFALRPLRETHGLQHPADVLLLLLPVSLVLGSTIVAIAAAGLGLVRIRETYVSAGIGMAAALSYAAVVWFAAPGARSASSGLYLTVAIFFINGLGFALAGLTSLSPRYAGIERFYGRHGRRMVPADMQLTMVALPFLWLAVVGAI